MLRTATPGGRIASVGAAGEGREGMARRLRGRKGRTGDDDLPTDVTEEDTHVLRWALAFLVLALIALVFGFTGIAADAAWIARILAFLFVVLFLISLIFGSLRGTPPPA